MAKRLNTALSQQQKQFLTWMRRLGILLFGVVLFAGFVTGLAWSLRPTESVTEKRELTAFPELTAQSFWDGSYFSDLALWYSDTFPMRDSLVSLAQRLKSCYGFTTSTMMVGGNQKGDEIPTVDPNGDGSATVPVSDRSEPDQSGAASSDTSAQPESEPEPEPEPAEPPDAMGLEAAIQQQIQQGLYVKNGAAYSIYYYLQDSAERYAAALNGAAEKLKGIANVYSILVPNNSGIMLSEEELNGLGGSNQEQAIAYYYHNLYSDDVIPVETYKILREHNDEYLYFRSDHHWTQLGAYYVYRSFCQTKGWTPHELDDFQTMVFTPFLGTFYDKLQNPDMAANPDTVTAYVPNGTNDMTFWYEDGTETAWHVIEDVSTWGRGSGYYCYIGGDRPMAVIKNPEIHDGSSCLVVKESYGNCFVPFLVDHYETVYVVDFRYAKVNVVDFVRDNGIDDLIIENNITIAAASGVPTMLASIL